MKQTKKILILLSLLLGLQVHAQTCNDSITPTTPDTRFIDNGDGTVTDKQTNLIWMRCALGQTRDGSTCTGSAATYTWQQALLVAADTTFAGSSAWQLPDIKQLTSIVEESCYGPAINLNIFPTTTSENFWTASPYANYNDFAWGVSFNHGNDDYGSSKDDSHYVRLVRPDSN